MNTGDGEVAGRLIVPVESSTKGFKKELKAKVEAAAKQVKAEVGIDLDAGALKAKVEAAVKAAASNVEVGIDLDAATLKAKVEAAAKAAAAHVTADVDTDKHQVEDAIEDAVGLAEAAARKGGGIKVPIQPSLEGRFFRRSLLRGSIMASIVSLIQPGVGALAQGVGGLSAMAGSIAPAVGTLAALPVGLSALVQGMVGVTTASGGVGQAIGALNEKEKALAAGTEWTAAQQKQLQDALDGLSPSAAKFAEEAVGLKGDWKKLRKEIQEPLFKPLAEEIRPLADKLLPRLQEGFKGTSEAAGATLRDAMEWMQGDRFGSNLAGVMAQNNRTIYAGGTAIRYLLDGFLEFQRAAEPFQRRMDRYLTRSAKWFRNTMRENRDDGSTERWLKKAGDRARLTWDIIKEFSGGIAGVFRAGDKSGMRLLRTFDGFLESWHEWVDSADGQERLSKWFANTEQGFLEFSRLINDTFKGIAKWGEDPAIAGMLRQIRTELGPALSDFLTDLGNNLAPNVISFFTSLTEVLHELAPMSAAVGDMVGFLALLGKAGAKLVEISGPLGDGALRILGYVLAFRTLKRLLTGFKVGRGLFGMFGGVESGLGRASKSAATLDTNLTKAEKKGRRLKRTLRGIGRIAGTLAGTLGFMAVSNAAEAGKSIHDEEGKIKQAFLGIDKTFSEYGAASKRTVNNVLTALTNTNFGQFADQFNLDAQKFARGLVDMQNTQFGTDAAKYVAEQQAALEEMAGDKSIMSALSMTWGTDAEAQTHMLLESIYKVTNALEESGTAALRAGAKARRTKKDLAALLNPTPAPTPKPGRDFIKGIVDGSSQKPPKLPAPKVDKEAVAEEGRKAGSFFTRAFASLKLKPVKLPKVDTSKATKSTKTAVDLVVANWRRMMMASTTGGEEVKRKTAAGMQGAVGAVQKKAAPMRTAAKNVRQAAVRPLEGMHGPLNTAGIQAMNGLAAGIRTQGAAAVAEAQRIAQQIAAATRTELDIHSPSRVMKKIGGYVTEGLALGIVHGSVKVAKARKKLTSMLTDSGWSAKQRKAFQRVANKDFAALAGLSRRWEATSRRLELAKKGVIGALFVKGKQRKEFTKGLVEGQKQYGSLTGLADFAGGFLTPGFAISELQRRVTQSKSFKANLKKLRKRGLGNRAYKELLEAGVEQGAPIAEQLLGATPQQLQQINRLQAKLTGVAKAMGKDTGRNFKAVGGNISRGMIQGLRANQHKLNQAAKDMAATFTRQIKKALGIHSPSRVMAGIGGHTIDGMTLGVSRRSRRLLAAARQVSGDLARELTPEQAHAKALYASGRAAKKASLLSAPAAHMAPLVGELKISGKDASEVRDALEEAMFILRKTRQGGVHAVRTA